MFSGRSIFWFFVCCWCSASLIHAIDDERNDVEYSTARRKSLEQCMDGRKNHDETDVDCGGVKCPRCEAMKACKADCDCISGNCQDKICTSSMSCEDKMKNQDETDVDCGGIFCPRCSSGKTCKVDCDCVSGLCKDNKCQGGCVPECKNNGKCLRNKCSCPPGYTGSLCEIESAGLCSAEQVSKSIPILMITFDKGTTQYSKKTPKDFGFTTTYQQSFASPTNDGYFSIVNSIPNDFESAWHVGAKDHTGNQGGYMLVVNANHQPGEFYRSTVNDLCIGRRYELSVFLANVCRVKTCGIKPNVLFEVRSMPGNELLAQLNSGDVEKHDPLEWKKYGISFVPKTKSVVLLMISNAPGGGGNDLVIDDIALRACRTPGSGPVLCPADGGGDDQQQ